MANVRELNRKIGSLRNMQKVMRAMNMISTTKLQKILGRLKALTTFEEGVRAMASDVALALQGSANPLITNAADPKRICVVLFTSDKGLCGSHNNAVQRAAATFMVTEKQNGREVETICIGSRGAAFCRRNGYAIHMSTDSNDRALSVDDLHTVANRLIGRVAGGEIQAVHFVYNQFVSTLFQRTNVLQVLPLAALLQEDYPQPSEPFIIEPGPERMATTAVERILLYLLEATLRHSRLSEHAARMTAMDNATKNSEDLITRYGAIRNRARQAQITSELSEIVAGKEALK